MEFCVPWIKKYRPKRIEDIILDENMVKYVNIFLQSNSNQHLILTGDSGVGKTTTVKCLVKQILGENAKERCLKLNAAGDRGVKVIASIIPPFCKKTFKTGVSRIIVLDEADNTTPKCQYDINCMIKQYSQDCRFIFICNDITKIIEDIQSVCCIVRYKKLTEPQVSKYLSYICEEEGLVYSLEALSLLHYVSGGDMRKAINDLQKTSFTFPKVVKKNVLAVCNLPDPDSIKEILDHCLKKNDDAFVLLQAMVDIGYYHIDLANGFIHVLTEAEIDERLKIRLVSIVSETKITLSSGVKSKLQLYGMLARMIMAID